MPSIRRRCAIVVIIIIINLIDINIIDDCRHTTVSSRPSPFTSPLSLPSPPSSSLMWQPLLEIDLGHFTATGTAPGLEPALAHTNHAQRSRLELCRLSAVRGLVPAQCHGHCRGRGVSIDCPAHRRHCMRRVPSCLRAACNLPEQQGWNEGARRNGRSRVGGAGMECGRAP